MDMRIAIVGGTGTLGRRVVMQLHRRGHDVRVLSRRSTQYRVDIRTGDGLDLALAGCDVVVDAANDPAAGTAAATLVEGSRRLLAAEADAGVRHHVAVSIVGCERVPMGYLRTKAAQEQVVSSGPVPWTIVRATQFHEFVAEALDGAARWRIIPGVPAKLQSVACADAATAVADVAVGPALGRRVDVAGPEVFDARDLVRTWRAITGRRVVMAPVPAVGALTRTLSRGAFTAPNADVVGRTTFESWLRDQQW
jgi:uncharacterized protein YbjT (DUF2867 family)